MKKIVICALLLCLILTACGQITPQEQLNGVLNTTTGVTTISTTEPKTDLNINEGGELPLFACYSWDEYIKFVSTTTLPDDFVLYEELRQIGNFQSLILLSYLYYGDFSSYLYGFEDEEGNEFSLYVKDEEWKDFGHPTVEHTGDMRTVAIGEACQVVNNGIIYNYLSGRIYTVKWTHNGKYFTLVFENTKEKLADGTSDFIQKILNSNTAEAAMQTFVASMESAAVK